MELKDITITGKALTRIRSLLTFGLAVTYLGNLLLRSQALEDLILVLMIIVIVLGFTAVTGSSKIIGYLSFAVSIALLLHFDAPLSVWRQALQDNLFLVVMFIMVPLMGIPIQHGGYTPALQSLFERHVNSNSRYYLLVSFLSAFIGVLVSLAVVPLVYQVCRNSSRSSDHKLLSSAISRGFSTCIIWAPTTAAIALVVQLTGSTWSAFFPLAISCGVIVGAVGYVMTVFEEKQKKKQERSYPVEDVSLGGDFDLRKLVELGAFSIVLIIGIGVISWVSGISAIIVVSVLALIYPMIWLILIERLPVFFREFKGDYFHNRLPSIKNEMILFVGAGLLANSINYSHLGDYVPQILSYLVGHNGLLLTLVIMGSTLCLAALGVHPIATVTIFGGTIKAAAYGVSPTYLALVLAISWAMGTSISPSAANVIAVSSIVGESPLQVGIRWNGPYVVLATLVLIVFLTGMRLLGVL
ncbi:C4-dicarboxylate ABC transporter [Desulfitobacterium chlororespirans]|uniref:C4-dicarboxylate ABC transporter n=1 Tax=Desulfitobacterium chlororespirans DSM 11544 TaxID=1121395 RepID=A0A1M7UVD2_9FIRM|nr:C4-dicarboxylate ABC transporter [Desulfitobacterium chlororespirans]SHN86942.1 hypothetical protein SAMN02745215_04748 [Desulfitobacterium chlororespirans DSM 11544]